MPILNSDLTRSAARSAMRLASSPTVIASGTTTSRTCLADGPACIWARFSFSRGALERGERAGAGIAVLAQRARDGELAALAAMLVAAAGRAGRLGALGRRVAVAGRRAALLVLVVGDRRGGRCGGRGGRARRRGGPLPRRRGGRLRRALPRPCDSPRRGASRPRSRPGPACPRGGGPPRAGSAARPRPRAAISPAVPCARSRRRPGARPAWARAGLGRARDRRRRGDGRLGASGAAASPGRPRMRAFLASTTTVFERPWLKLCFTLPASTVRLRPSGARVPSFGLSVVSLTQNPSFIFTADASGAADGP